MKSNENNQLQQFIDVRKYNFYFWILQYKGCIELGDYWPTHTNHKSERATFGWIMKGIISNMKSCLGAKRAGSCWWADPNDPAH